MPIELPLPKSLSKARWKVKIQEKETREPPHVSILRGTDKWRINLRTGGFMDRRPKPSEVPDELLEVIREKGNWEWLCRQWDAKYPDNPVSSVQVKDDDEEHNSVDAT
ncbi:MAG: hypothetical protein WD847_13470 [Pirellulales bacterium]